MATIYRVTRDGSIVDAKGGVLYYSSDIAHLSRSERIQLAKLHTHTADPSLDYEHAEALILKTKGGK